MEKGRYISLTPSPWLPWWTWSVDYLNGLPIAYPKWTTLKFVPNINLTMLESEEKMRSIDKHNYGTLIPSWTLVTKYWRTKKEYREAEFQRVVLLLRTQELLKLLSFLEPPSCITITDQNIVKLAGAASAWACFKVVYYSFSETQCAVIACQTSVLAARAKLMQVTQGLKRKPLQHLKGVKTLWYGSQ